MLITRRQFLKYCSVAAGALGLSTGTIMKLEQALADVAGTAPDVVWLAGQGCSGCITSLLNTKFYTDIGSLLLDTADLLFQETIQAACGAFINDQPVTNNATQNTRAAYNSSGGYVLLVEGATPTGSNGDFCHVGDLTGDVAVGEKMEDVLVALAKKAGVVLSIGTCSAFGGIPAGKPNPTTAKKTSEILSGVSSTYYDGAIDVPVVNVPGCPPHPDWIVGTILTYIDSIDPASKTNTINNALKNLVLNRDGCPSLFYGEYQCNAGPCVWRYNNNQARDPDNYDSNYGEGNSKLLGKNKWVGQSMGCIGILGCKGRKTKADCSARKWNTSDKEEYGVNWCVGSRAGCHGCTYPTFPDGVGKFFTFR